MIPRRPSDQCQGWTVSTHPEGKRYAHVKSQVGITIVTEARIAEVSGQLNAWLAVIYDMIAEKQVHLPGTCDLFLEIHKDLGTCNYYFADHELRTVFWLHMLDKISVGLPPPSSSGYIRMSLINLFAFPCGIKNYVQSTPRRKITGFTSSSSPDFYLNILRRL